MRENSDRFIQHATRTWIALTAEILVTAILFVCFNLVGIPKNASILLTLLVAIVAVLIGVTITSKESSKISFKPILRTSAPNKLVEQFQAKQGSVEQSQAKQELVEQSQAEQKLIENPRHNEVPARLYFDLDRANFNRHLVKLLVQDLTQQSHFEQLCANHLTWHLDFQRDAWSKVEPILLHLATHKVGRIEVTPTLLKTTLDEQLHIEQGWIESLVWGLTAQSQIRQSSVQKLLQSSDVQQGADLLIESLTKESNLAQTCAIQIKSSLSMQTKAIQSWPVFLKQNTVEKNDIDYKRFERFLEQLDMQTRFEQEISRILKRGFDVQKKTEQFWIVAMVQYLTEGQTKQELFRKFTLPTEPDWFDALIQIRYEQTKAEQLWVETLIKHSEEDKVAEQKLDETFSYGSEEQLGEQTKVETPSESQTWQNFIDSIEQRLEKRKQINEEVARDLAESLEEQSQVKQEAANLLKESLMG